MDQLFTMIGKMYVDIVQAQKVINDLQTQLEERDKEIQSLQSSLIIHQKSE